MNEPKGSPISFQRLTENVIFVAEMDSIAIMHTDTDQYSDCKYSNLVAIKESKGNLITISMPIGIKKSTEFFIKNGNICFIVKTVIAYDKKIAEKRKEEAITLLKESVEKMNFSTRTLNGLTAVNIRTIAELARKSESELLKIKNFGRRSLQEVKKKLKDKGIES